MGAALGSQDHPVWLVYDFRRTSRLNELYYGSKLKSLERTNLLMEILIASTSSSSAIASFAFWKTGAGQSFWQALLVITAVIAILKPFLSYAKRIKKYDELLNFYRLISHDLRELCSDIEQDRAYSAKHQRRYKEIRGRLRQSINGSPERLEDKKTKERCEKQVLAELEPNQFYIPEGDLK